MNRSIARFLSGGKPIPTVEFSNQNRWEANVFKVVPLLAVPRQVYERYPKISNIGSNLYPLGAAGKQHSY